MSSEDLVAAEGILRPFIDEGFVVLQATGLTPFFTCDEPDLAKLRVYHQCLYYFKGLFEFSATWDLDEYWMAPAQLEVTGRSSFRYDIITDVGVDVPSIEKSFTHAENRTLDLQFIEKSSPSSFSHLITSDPLWQNSKYSKSISIRDVVRAIEQFHKYHGCEDKWCFYLSPSFYSYLKKNVTRTDRIFNDFAPRDSKGSRIWQKAIARTQAAMMGGIHLPGSCQFPNDPMFYPYTQNVQCDPHIWDSGEFGRLHHYQSLMEFRDDWDVVHEEDWVDDEYVSFYADTVSKQLGRRYYGITVPGE